MFYIATDNPEVSIETDRSLVSKSSEASKTKPEPSLYQFPNLLKSHGRNCMTLALDSPIDQRKPQNKFISID